MQTRPIHAGFPGVIEADSRFPGLPFQRDQFAAARERQRHREALRGEIEQLDRQIAQESAHLARLQQIREGIAAQLARASA